MYSLRGSWNRMFWGERVVFLVCEGEIEDNVGSAFERPIFAT